MNKACSLFLGLLLYASLSFAQTQHLDGQTTLINPTGRTLELRKDDEDSWLTFHDPGQYWYSMGIDRSNAGALSLNYGGVLNSSQFVMTKGGNIGIGTSSPKAKLHVNGDLFLGNSELRFSSSSGGNNRISSLGDSKIYGRWTFKSRYDNIILDAGENTSNKRAINFSTGGESRMIIHPSGNVGIGTTLSSNPHNYKLAVNGTIGAKEIKVETSSSTWADFVFEGNYQLPTLQEVEAHIQKKGHLKDIPSAQEVAENGIDVAEMDAKLLQKIEELTLYTIQQQKELEDQRKENADLKDLILQLTARIEKLEKE